MAWFKIKGIRVKFCDAEGIITFHKPKVQYELTQGDTVIYKIKCFVRLANFSLRERGLESVYISIKAKKQEVAKRMLSQFPIGERIPALHTLPELIELDTQFSLNKYKLNQLVGENHSKVKIELTVTSTDFKTYAHLPVVYKEVLHV